MFYVSMILLIILWKIDKNNIFVIWLLGISALLRFVEDVVPAMREELFSVTYPPRNCRQIKKCGILFGWKYRKGVTMPMEIILMVTYWYAGGIVFSLVYWIVGNTASNMTRFYILLGYCFWILVILLYFSGKGFKVSFYEKYKKLTRYNFKYRLFQYYLEEPERYEIGKCMVIARKKKKREMYVAVKMADSQEVIKDVLFCAEKPCHKNEMYTLYEICKVRYIE